MPIASASPDGNEILDLERRLLDPAVRADADQVASLLADEFVEFGSSGRVFHKGDAVGLLPSEMGLAFSLSDFEARQLAPDLVLATYRAMITDDRSSRHSLRSSLWVRSDGRWQILFHQGTPCAPPA